MKLEYGITVEDLDLPPLSAIETSSGSGTALPWTAADLHPPTWTSCSRVQHYCACVSFTEGMRTRSPSMSAGRLVSERRFEGNLHCIRAT